MDKFSTRSSDDVPTPSVEEFLKTVIRSGLIQRDQLLLALRGFPAEQRHDTLALSEHLIKTGQLSRFQARKLLQGVARGLILASFQILSLIGKGGMGRVYLARDSRDGRLVALKILPPSKARAKERLLARISAAKMELSQKVSHPHLCRTFEAAEFHGVNYLAMEFIPGQTLSRLINTGGPLELPRAARLMAEVASGLEHAHQQGLVHRDLKPSNIMITPHDHAKVLDLGLALIQGEKADPSVTGGQGYVVGTMDYISPEQTTNAMGVDGRADIYSLGCTLYFTLTGRPPFPGGTSIEKIHRHRKEEPEPLLKLRPALPVPFVALVHQMMAKDPRLRFPSARAVEEKLWLWGRGAAGGAPGPGRRSDLRPGGGSVAARGTAERRQLDRSGPDRGWPRGCGAGGGATGPGGCAGPSIAARVVAGAGGSHCPGAAARGVGPGHQAVQDAVSGCCGRFSSHGKEAGHVAQVSRSVG